MSAAQSPKSPATFRKPLPTDAQRKVSQDPPAPFNASQASQFRSGSYSPSPYRAYSPGANSEIGRGLPSEINMNENDEHEQAGPEVNLHLEADEEIQVPATNPADRALSTPNSMPRNVSRSSGTRTLLPSERDTSPAETSAENGVDLDLEDFDMSDFQSRYYAELSIICKEETELIAEFDKFSETFALWAQSASQRDTDRASKRLKTRETFVVLAEDSLEAKKAHYEQVIQAFKNALNLLGH